MNTKIARTCSLARCLAVLSAGVVLLPAQTVPLTPVKTESKEESEDKKVILLSPFVVSAAEDEGYMASSTLAGSRLNMPLRDVGAAITAVTKQFLEDTHATDVNEMLVYTVNTESGGLEGNALGAPVGGNAFVDEDNVRRNPQSSTRIRSLAPADRSRNFFTTAIPQDNYNVDRVEISRGANATLFGLGSPAGVINNTIIQARTNADSNEVSVGYGNENSYRVTADFNKVLIKDKLALRLALLRDDREFEQDPTFENDRRAHLSATARLVDTRNFRLTFNGSYENGEIDALRPRRGGPGDRTNAWLYAGSFPRLPSDNRGPNFPLNFLSPDDPRFRAPNALFAPRVAANPPPVPVPSDFFDRNRDMFHFPNSFRHMNLVFEQNGTTPGVAGAAFNGFQSQRLAGWVNNQGVANGFKREDLSFMTVWFINQFSSQAAQNSSLPLDVFDYTQTLLGGSSGFVKSDFDALDLSLQSTFLDNQFGLEVAFHNSQLDDAFSEPINSASGYHVMVDPNVQLTDGTPNPNFGRLFTMAETNLAEGRDEQKGVRVTGFAAFDARKRWNNWFGRLVGSHRLTGLYSRFEREVDNLLSNLAWAGELGAFAVDRPNADNQERAVRQFIYFGDSVAGRAPNDFTVNPQLGWTQPKDGDVFSVRYWNRNDQNFKTDDFRVQRVFNNGTELSGLEVDSAAFVLQSNWLRDSIVSIIGWRDDSAKSFSSRNPLPAGTVINESNNGIVDTPFDLSVAPDELTRNFGQKISDKTWSYSVVGHVSDWIRLPWNLQLSLHYNNSQNFQTLAGDVNIFGEFLAPPSGKTEDYGFTLSTKDNRASLKVNFYESDIKNVRSGALTSAMVNGVFVLDFQTIELWYDGLSTGWVTPADIQWFTDGIPQSVRDLVNFQVSQTPAGDTFASFVNPNVSDTEDLVGEGIEIEGTFNVTPSWRLHFNVAKAEAVSSNIAPAFRRYVELRRPVWGDARVGLTSRTSEKPRAPGELPNVNDTTNPAFPAPGSFQTTSSDAIGRAFTHVEALDRLEGSPSDRIREWRFNLVSNYQFREGRLKGIGLGGAYRWEDSAVVSFGRKNVVINPGTPFEDTVSVTDFDNPFVSPSKSNVDLWVSYRRKILNRKVDWSIQFNLRNATADSKGLLPITFTPDGRPTAFILEPTRSWWITNTFKF